MIVDISSNAAAAARRMALRSLVVVNQILLLRLGQEMADTLLPALIAEAPVSPDEDENPYSSTPREPPGYLRDTLRATVEGVGRGVRVSFTTDADYVTYVIDGTQPHTIVPINGQFLVFAAGGDFVFAHSVQHPGTAPNPFHTRAYDAVRPEMDLLLHRTGSTIAMAFR